MKFPSIIIAMVKVICCDIDGTLVKDDKTLSENNIFWIRKAVQEKNIAFMLVSGRMYNGVKPFYEILGITGPVSCYNGGTLYDDDGNIIEDYRMNHDVSMEVLKIQRLSEETSGVGMILFNDKHWYLEQYDDFIYPWKKKIYQSECVIGNFEELLSQFDTNKIVFMSPREEKIDFIDSLVRDAGLYEEKLTPYRLDNCLELSPVGINKGLAIDSLSRHFNVPYSQIMAIGDDYNDIEMLQKAGVSVAMENSVPEAKQVARYVTDTNNNDGVAKAIQHFVFGYKN